MNIAGLKFRLLKGSIMYNTPGVIIYKHKSSGKCFVRATKNCRTQKSNNNFPMHLKQFLKKNPSEVVMYLSEVPVDSREILHMSARAAADELSERGLLYRNEQARVGIYKQLRGEAVLPYTLHSLVHSATGAVYYFYEQQGTAVTERVLGRLKTFNGYVAKNVVNPNRVMHYFAKAHGPLALEHFTLRDLQMSLQGEREAKIALTKICKTHLEQGEVVLNRVCDTDVLYYRNAIMKLEHKDMNEYLKLA